MNNLVECVLDGEYWNIVGDSRKRHERAKQKVFTYDVDHIPMKITNTKPKVMFKVDNKRKDNKKKLFFYFVYDF